MGDKESRDYEKNLRRTPKKSQSETDPEPETIPKQPAAKMSDPYGHPVYNEISYINGQINRMDVSQMRNRCKEVGLEPAGKREALKRRLKEYFKAEKLIEAGLLERNNPQNVEYFLVIDFEATCEEKNPPGYPHEIIEFPVVLVSSGNPEPHIVDVFHSFVRPVLNPQLSEFCYTLTGITQDIVDASDPFPIVHSNFVRWMKSHSLGITKSFSIVTDGPFDMGRFLFLQTLHLNMDYPSYAKYWTNLRKCFANFYKGDFYASQHTPQRLPGLQNMLSSLGMEFEGHPHSGLDDAKNIARVLVRLIKDGAVIRVNEKIADDCVDDNNRDKSRLVSVTPVNRRESEQLFSKQQKLMARARKSEKCLAETESLKGRLEPVELFKKDPVGPLDDCAIIYSSSQSSVNRNSENNNLDLMKLVGALPKT